MFFVIIVLSIPVYLVNIWALYEPEEAFLFLRRWQYKDAPEISDLHKKFIRIISTVTMVFWTILLIQSGIEAFQPDPMKDIFENIDQNQMP